MVISVDTLQSIGANFLANHSDGLLDAKDVFKITNRGSRVILSAPHATNTFVAQKKKKIDLFTGEIALCLGEYLGVTTIVRQKYVGQKCLISDYIIENNLGEHFFLDLHGMSSEREFELAVGTGYCEAEEYHNELSLIDVLAKKYNISYVVNHPDYRGCPGLTGRYQKHYQTANVLQLEWRLDHRNYYSHPEIVLNKTLPFLRELIQNLIC